MAFTERERKLGIGVGVALAAVGAFFFVYEPLANGHAKVKDELALARTDMTKAENEIAKQRREEKVWAEMIAGGLKSNPSEADSQLLHALPEWAGGSKIAITSLNQSGKTQEGKFQIITYQFNGVGSTAAIANFLWRLETATIPVRINDVQVTPKKEGVDELQLQASVSTLSMVPEADPAGRNERGRALTSAAGVRGGRS